MGSEPLKKGGGPEEIAEDTPGETHSEDDSISKVTLCGTGSANNEH